ncbi:MAG TPA: ribokinase [Feifaniaceae bacterium]|nr:ribokinase [Feifaniaceae bacterium]
MKKLAVVGSINMDIVSTMEQYPRPGETIRGRTFGTFPGGKGANQAVAAGRLGADVLFLGMVGDDLYGQEALRALKAANVDTGHIEVCPDTNTGVACIWVNGGGENCIVLEEGANGRVDIPYIKRHIDALADCCMVLLQLEIPMETVEWVAGYCKKNGIKVMFDPAPAAACSRELLSNVDYITPNEGEILAVSGCPDATGAAKYLLERGVGRIVNKAGADGCCLVDREKRLHVKGYKVNAVDTTAAGDSFNAGLAVALSKGMDEVTALKYANAVGAYAVTGMGAQSSMPTEEQVYTLMEQQK